MICAVAHRMDRQAEADKEAKREAERRELLVRETTGIAVEDYI
jgi:hypothetical protein